jgi:hypothetical protein
MLSVMSERAISEILSGLGIQHSSSDLGEDALSGVTQSLLAAHSVRGSMISGQSKPRNHVPSEISSQREDDRS